MLRCHNGLSKANHKFGRVAAGLTQQTRGVYESGIPRALSLEGKREGISHREPGAHPIVAVSNAGQLNGCSWSDVELGLESMFRSSRVSWGAQWHVKVGANATFLPAVWH